ncbi:MAG: Gfo/Idh/MocA family oxidoreductase [Opitutaceae bacterium]|nr:Gfo/Idh/MocA family oxidoreductase [Opitutaceae bacterium]
MPPAIIMPSATRHQPPLPAGSCVPVGIAGLNFGRHIIDQLTAGDGAAWLRVAAVCDLDAAKAAAMAERLGGGVRAFDDLQKLIDAPGIPAIGLFTGPAGRASLIRRIIRAGKDVITTKPFETDPDAALAVLREARALGRVVHLNSPAPLPAPDIAQIERWRVEYDLGAPVGARADVWASYRETADGSWYDDPGRCPAAPIFRLGIYLVNDLVRLFGPVADAHVMQTRLFTGRPTPDNAQLSLRFENGALAGIFASFCVNDGDHYRNGLTLNFENGTLYRNLGPARGDAGKSELALVQLRDGARRVVARAEVAGGSGAYQWETFARAVRREPFAGAESSATTPEQVAAGLRVIQMMSRQPGGFPPIGRRPVAP